MMTVITYQTVMIDQAKFSIDKNVGGNLKGLNGKVEVDLPASALNELLDFDIRNPALQTQPSLSLTWQPVEIIAVGKDSKKNIDKFKAPIKLKVKYDETQLSNWDESALAIYYYDQDFRDWFPMETTVDTKNNTLQLIVIISLSLTTKPTTGRVKAYQQWMHLKVADFTGAGTYAINFMDSSRAERATAFSCVKLQQSGD